MIITKYKPHENFSELDEKDLIINKDNHWQSFGLKD